jgi:hypothetical protein
VEHVLVLKVEVKETGVGGGVQVGDVDAGGEVLVLIKFGKMKGLRAAG